MIRPPLPRVSEGQILDLNLTNQIIQRTEYAADLLRQYRPLAGENIGVSQEQYGRRLSSAIEEIDSRKYKFRVVSGGGRSIYDPNTKTSTIPTGTSPTDSFYDISGNFVVGARYANTSEEEDFGLIYNGSSFTTVQFGVVYQPGDIPYTELRGTDGSSAVGFYEYDTFDESSIYGVQCNLAGQKIRDIIYPKIPPQGFYEAQATDAYDVYEDNIIGETIIYYSPTPSSPTARSYISWLFNNGTFTILTPELQPAFGFFPYYIYKDYILGLYGHIYKISTGQIIKVIKYNGDTVLIFGLYENIVSCRPYNGSTNLLYYIDQDRFEIVDFLGAIG